MEFYEKRPGTAGSAENSGLHRTALRSRSVRLAVVGAAFALLLGSCGCAAAPPPPKPKPPASGSAQVCFGAWNNIGYGAFWGSYTGPVNVDAWIKGQSSQVTTVETNSRGCVNMALIAGYSWRFRVYSHQSNSYWVGSSEWKYVRAGGRYDYGTVPVDIIYDGGS